MDIFLALNCLFDVLVVLTGACCTGRKKSPECQRTKVGQGEQNH